MQILDGLEGLTRLPPGAVVSIGNFDGMHRGHERILEVGRGLCAGAAPRPLAVVTFEPHPLTVLRPEMAPPRLTPPQIKEGLLCREGVDYLVELAPEPAVLNLLAEEFWHLLRDRVRPSNLVEGNSFYFGKGRGGTIQKLREWTAASEIHLEIVQAVRVALLDLSMLRVSSSLVRWLIKQGRVRDAAICLGRPYALQGEVVMGHQRGRTIGVPTANLRCEDQLVPADGVYVGRCWGGGTTYPAAVSIGTMPTFGENVRQVEVHLIGYTGGDLYGQTLTVELVDWLRDQMKFSSVEALKRQMARDIQIATERSKLDPAVELVEIDDRQVARSTGG